MKPFLTKKIIAFTIVLLFNTFLFAQDISTQDSNDDIPPTWVTPEKNKDYANAPFVMEAGKKQFVAIANLDNSVQSGKYRQDWNEAAIPYSGREIWVKQFSICAHGSWLELTNANFINSVTGGIAVPSNALVCGHEKNGKLIYAVSITTKKYGAQIGKYSNSTHQISFSYAGNEIFIHPQNGTAFIEGENAEVAILLKPAYL